MSSKGRPLFDLNEPPAEEEDIDDGVYCFQPQRAIPSSSTAASDLFAVSTVPPGIVNNHAFSHASSVSGFQPFVRHQISKRSHLYVEEKCIDVMHIAPLPQPSNAQDLSAAQILQAGSAKAQDVEKEEGEWSDTEVTIDADKNMKIYGESSGVSSKLIQEKSKNEMMRSNDLICEGDVSLDSQDFKTETSSPSDLDPVTSSRKGDVSADSHEASAMETKQKDVKGIEANHTSKYVNNLGKHPKPDQQKEAMLGKKRSRRTMFLNLEDVKQAGALKTSIPRKHISAPTIVRTVKEARTAITSSEQGDKLFQPVRRESKQSEMLADGGNGVIESNDSKNETDGDTSAVHLGRPRSFSSSTDLTADGQTLSVSRHGSWKSSTDVKNLKRSQIPGRKPAVSSQTFSGSKLAAKKSPYKKLPVVNTQYQDTSIERLLREVTNEKFWHHPEEEELQRVPGRFESIQEYIRVFEPLLFEECRAQLHSTWEESSEAVANHVRVVIKSTERRERGWYDVILLLLHEHKWAFKEGDVAVLSTPKPGSVNFKRNNSSAFEDEESVTGRVSGTVRRHIPIDNREHTGAILHFYIGDLNDGKADDHILRKLQPGGVWYLTVLGSLATSQREYVALHAFRRINMQMQNAILQPSPDQFPKYEQQPPAMPECFTSNFVEYLRKNFNGPQLAAIQWAAMHTASGTSNVMANRQEPWPFTLVQGPPGTGKTHTVWGMLNVIHLVQYKHYYAALLKKLSPESYEHANENDSRKTAIGSIDEVLQSMDQNLFRILPTLCPKPRMLVCAPSNAATDELLSRVLDRGFIDGEMKIYRPDVARVGVDSPTRAAQAVSVERRTEQLLMKSPDEVYGWMSNLRARETQLSQQITVLQKDLNVAAATGRAQGSVGVDPDVLVARDQNRDTLLQSLAAVVENRDKVLVEMSRLVILEGRFRSASNFNMEEARSSLEASFANEAEIVFTTVSSSGRKLFSRLTHGFDMVVIDEAAQASEVAVLPPLSLGAARCVLVGDPQQLPATVISKAAGTLLYSRSLFERFQLAGCPTMLLSVQYRMHPQIRDFPSRHFYQGRLTDSDTVLNLPDESYYKDPLLRPFLFYDIAHGRESHKVGSLSYQNSLEAQFCARLYEHLKKAAKTLGMRKVSVGIITPYKLQFKCLQREFKEILNSEEGKDVYINTVDAFQGQERDVVIISCVRASKNGVGFVADIRRMNVALTRARRALWVMGNANALLQSDDWAALIADAKARNCYLNMDSLPKKFLPPYFSSYGSFPSKIPSSKGFRSGPRYRSHDSHMEPKSGTPSEDDEKSNSSSATKNGSHRLLKPETENSLDG